MAESIKHVGLSKGIILLKITIVIYWNYEDVEVDGEVFEKIGLLISVENMGNVMFSGLRWELMAGFT